MQVHGGCISGADIAAWLYGVSVLCESSGFLSSLHCPAGAEDMGHFGVTYMEILILFEQWAGHRLLSEKVTRPHVRAHRPISFSSVSQKKMKFGKCAFFISQIFALSGWESHVQASSLGVGTVLTRSNLQTVGDLSSSLPSGCRCGSFWMVL